jgi:hypothetical protein
VEDEWNAIQREARAMGCAGDAVELLLFAEQHDV